MILKLGFKDNRQNETLEVANFYMDNDDGVVYLYDEDDKLIGFINLGLLAFCYRINNNQ